MDKIEVWKTLEDLKDKQLLVSREKKKNSKKRKLQENPDICIEDIIS